MPACKRIKKSPDPNRFNFPCANKPECGARLVWFHVAQDDLDLEAEWSGEEGRLYTVTLRGGVIFQQMQTQHPFARFGPLEENQTYCISVSVKCPVKIPRPIYGCGNDRVVMNTRTIERCIAIVPPECERSSVEDLFVSSHGPREVAAHWVSPGFYPRYVVELHSHGKKLSTKATVKNSCVFSNLKEGESYCVTVFGLCLVAGTYRRSLPATACLTLPESCAPPSAVCSPSCHSVRVAVDGDGLAFHWVLSGSPPRPGRSGVLLMPNRVIEITGLEESSAYTMNIYAECASGGLSSPASIECKTTACDCSEVCKELRILDVLVGGETSDSVQLSWSSNRCFVAYGGYVVETYRGSELQSTEDFAASPVRIQGLAENTAYTFKVYGKCEGGRSIPGSANGRTVRDGCANITIDNFNVETVRVSETIFNAVLTWTAEPNPPVVAYHVSIICNGSALAHKKVEDPKWVFSGLTYGARYEARVIGECVGGHTKESKLEIGPCHATVERVEPHLEVCELPPCQGELALLVKWHLREGFGVVKGWKVSLYENTKYPRKIRA